VGPAASLQLPRVEPEMGDVVLRAGHPPGDGAQGGTERDRWIAAEDDVPLGEQRLDGRVDGRPGRGVGADTRDR
jgi:hypothetical protein